MIWGWKCTQLNSTCHFRYLFIGFPTQIIAFVVIDFSYLPFHATFDRGVKVRLFCSPQWH